MTIPTTGSKCPARIWPFRKHRFTCNWSCNIVCDYNNCQYCGGKKP